jgi:group II intron reverse transcriptase/maturase
MSGALTLESMSPGLLKVAERAQREPGGQFHSLAHLMDEAALERAYHRLRKSAAVGVDGVSKDRYGERLQENIRDLHQRMKDMRYRHQPIRRVHIPKEKGKTRPIGISSTEDKIVQGALREVLEAIYEQDFLDCSYGFRPGRSAHGAVRALTRAVDRGEGNWVLEADIRSFFDSLDRQKLKEMLQVRIPDGAVQRLIGKCLRAGVLDGEEFIQPEEGTAQGSILSPLLGNVYLHYALDLWFEKEAKPRLKGKATLVRYADDFVIAFEKQEDAARVMEVLPKRLAKYGLSLNEEKTRLIRFERPPREQRDGKGPGTFDFLGFTWYWHRARRGGWTFACKTRRARLRRAIMAVYSWCRSHRHEKVPAQHAALVRRIRGHMNYFGVNGNMHALWALTHHAERAWFKWLRRRSNKNRLTWERFNGLLKAYPLPRPKVYVPIWGSVP